MSWDDLCWVLSWHNSMCNVYHTDGIIKRLTSVFVPRNDGFSLKKLDIITVLFSFINQLFLFDTHVWYLSLRIKWSKILCTWFVIPMALISFGSSPNLFIFSTALSTHVSVELSNTMGSCSTHPSFGQTRGTSIWWYVNSSALFAAKT